MAISVETQAGIVWGCRIVLAMAFAAAGAAKLIRVKPMVELFDKIGIGQWFRTLTGVVELVAAGLILYRATGFLGAALMLAMMVVAVPIHLLRAGGSPVPAITLGTLAAVVVYLLSPVS